MFNVSHREDMMVVHFVELLEVLFFSSRMFPSMLKAQKGSAFLCCQTFGMDVFTK